MSESRKPDTSELLDQLRDIQEPLAPEGTSLWIIAATVLLSLLLIGGFWHQRKRRLYASQKEALKTIDMIVATHDGNTSSSLFDLATLLRQLMRHRVGDTINTLDGAPWLAALDEEFLSQWFSEGRGQVFGSVVYQKTSADSIDLGSLCDELKQEIRRLKPVSRRT